MVTDMGHLGASTLGRGHACRVLSQGPRQVTLTMSLPVLAPSNGMLSPHGDRGRVVGRGPFARKRAAPRVPVRSGASALGREPERLERARRRADLEPLVFDVRAVDPRAADDPGSVSSPRSVR
jgi:hypothetical protein